MWSKRGFTLSELLIALAILGILATFTIPKVLQSQSDSSYNSRAKEAIAALSQALEAKRADGTLTTSTRSSDLSPYLNYLYADTVSAVIDHSYGNTTATCNSTSPCVWLASGAALRFEPNQFYNTTASNGIFLLVDPDGKVTGSGAAGGPGKSLFVWLYWDGKVRTYGTIMANTQSYAYGSTQYHSPQPSQDPPWFSWN